MAIDAFGGTAYDPSENVLQLTEAAVQRIDDMADLQARLADEKIKRMEAVAILRADHAREIRTLESNHNASLRHAESARIDSIRQVDREEIAKTAVAANTALTTLARQTTDLQQTLAKQVTDTAAAQEARNSAQYNDINKRLSALELSSSEGKGKQQVSDPQLDRMAAMVEKLVTAQATGTGKSEGLSMSVAIVMGAITIVSGLLAIGAGLYAVLK